MFATTASLGMLDRYAHYTTKNISPNCQGVIYGAFWGEKCVLLVFASNWILIKLQPQKTPRTRLNILLLHSVKISQNVRSRRLSSYSIHLSKQLVPLSQASFLPFVFLLTPPTTVVFVLTGPCVRKSVKQAGPSWRSVVCPVGWLVTCLPLGLCCSIDAAPATCFEPTNWTDTEIKVWAGTTASFR